MIRQRLPAPRCLIRLQPKSNATQATPPPVESNGPSFLQWLEPIKKKFERAAVLTQKLREDETERQAKRVVFRQRFGVTILAGYLRIKADPLLQDNDLTSKCNWALAGPRMTSASVLRKRDTNIPPGLSVSLARRPHERSPDGGRE